MPVPTPRGAVVWAVVLAAIAVPLIAAATSPLLAWREPVYILAGLAGVAGLALLLLQPLLILGALPGLSPVASRRLHRGIGALLVLAVAVHVGALWITSPPDVVDALLLRSPTPFSLWGVIAMWAVFGTAFLAARRRRLRALTWRRAHVALAVAIVAGTVLHALLIQGTMEVISKAALCALVGVATLRVIMRTRL